MVCIQKQTVVNAPVDHTVMFQVCQHRLDRVKKDSTVLLVGFVKHSHHIM